MSMSGRLAAHRKPGVTDLNAHRSICIQMHADAYAYRRIQMHMHTDAFIWHVHTDGYRCICPAELHTFINALHDIVYT